MNENRINQDNGAVSLKESKEKLEQALVGGSAAERRREKENRQRQQRAIKQTERDKKNALALEREKNESIEALTYAEEYKRERRMEQYSIENEKKNQELRIGEERARLEIQRSEEESKRLKEKTAIDAWRRLEELAALARRVDGELSATEQSPAEQSPAEQTSEQTAPTEETLTQNTTAQETPAEHTSNENAPSEQISVEHTDEQASAQEGAGDETPSEQTSEQTAPEEELPSQQTPAQGARASETSAEDAPVQDSSAEQSAAEESTAQQAPAEQTATQEAAGQTEAEDDEDMAPLVIDGGEPMELLRLEGFCAGGIGPQGFIDANELRSIEQTLENQHAPTVNEPFYANSTLFTAPAQGGEQTDYSGSIVGHSDRPSILNIGTGLTQEELRIMSEYDIHRGYAQGSVPRFGPLLTERPYTRPFTERDANLIRRLDEQSAGGAPTVGNGQLSLVQPYNPSEGSQDRLGYERRVGYYEGVRDLGRTEKELSYLRYSGISSAPYRGYISEKDKRIMEEYRSSHHGEMGPLASPYSSYNPMLLSGDYRYATQGNVKGFSSTELELMRRYDESIGNTGSRREYPDTLELTPPRVKYYGGFSANDFKILGSSQSYYTPYFDYSDPYRNPLGVDGSSVVDMRANPTGELYHPSYEKGAMEWELTELDRYMRARSISAGTLGRFGSFILDGKTRKSVEDYEEYMRHRQSRLEASRPRGAVDLAGLLTNSLGLSPEFDRVSARRLRKRTENTDLTLIKKRNSYHISKLRTAVDFSKLTFAHADRDTGREARRAERELDYWLRVDGVAEKAQSADNRRYYSFVTKDPKRSASKHVTRQELALLRERLSVLIEERHRLNERLIALYEGGKHGQSFSEKKDAAVRKSVLKAYSKQKRVANEVASARLSYSDKERVFSAMDERTSLTARLTGLNFTLKKGRLRGKARRETKRARNKCARALLKCERRVNKLVRRARIKGADNSRAHGYMILSWLLLIAIVLGSVWCYYNWDKVIALLPTVKSWFTPGSNLKG